MNILRSFTIKSMKIHRKWTVVTIVGVILSSAMLSGLMTFTASTQDLLKRDRLDSNGKWTVSFQNVPVSGREKWESASDDSQSALAKDVGYALLDGSTNSDKPYLYITQYDRNAFDMFSVNVTSGRLPENDQEIVLPEKIGLNAGVSWKIGDRIELSNGIRMYPDNTEVPKGSYYADSYYVGDSDDMGSEKFFTAATKTYTVVGFISTSILESSWDAAYYCFTGFSHGAASEIEKADIFLWNSNLPFNYYDVIRGEASKMGYDSSTLKFNDDYLRYCGIQPAGNGQDLMFIMVAVIVLIIMAASISLIYNAFQISVSERLRHLGLLSSAGATRRQKRYHVYFEGLIVGLIGIPTGILCGILGISCTFKVIESALISVLDWKEMKLHVNISFAAIAITVALSAFTIIISVLIPAIRASRITPIDAIRQTREIRMTPRSVRTPRFLRKIYGFEGELAMKNFRRNRRKYRATIVSLVISLVLFLTVSAYVQFGFTYTYSSTETINYDICFSAYGISDAEREKLSGEIRELPDTEKMAECVFNMVYVKDGEALQTDMYKTANEGVPGTGLYVFSYDDESFREYAASLGLNPDDYMDPNHPKAIVINHSVVYDYATGKKMIGDLLNLSEGTTLNTVLSTLDNEDGDLSGFPVTPITVGKITEELPLGADYYSASYARIILPESVMHSIALTYLPDSSDYPNPTAYIVADDDKRLEAEIHDMTKTLPESQYYIYNLTSQHEQSEKTVFLISVFVYGFITLISLICIANIFNTITTNVSLRRKEFAMLRSVGMTGPSFGRMIRFECIFYGLKALILGIPVSIAISYYLYKQQMYAFSYDFSLPWKSYVAAILLVFLIVFTTMSYSMSRIRKENIVETLKMDSI